ncbi:MAG: PorP/SprF family type IX secretion system membrane protein [Cytophagaceae bacterium]|nr:PorP/SprF family type IX secretion system membrane protein [Cytophagaceae bacterium]MDW8456062.1 PorP/SprF family type IX secretion system membrane protein [Cytophagaceae bacterium]
MKKNILTLLAVACMAFTTSAQNMSHINNFMINQLYYSPAAAGMHETQVNVSLLGRIQWASVEGAPKTAILWTDYRTPSQNMALGLLMNTYQYAGFRSNDIHANYAYLLNLNRKIKLSMGLRAGLSSIESSTSRYRIWDENDPMRDRSSFSGTLPKFGTGFQLNAKKFYAGFSLPDFIIVDSRKLLEDSAKFFSRERNYVLMAGNSIRLNDLYTLKPNAAFFYHKDVGTLLKLNALFEIKNYFWAGLTYGTNQSLALLAGSFISSRIRFTYSYDFLIGIRNAGGLIGAHEIGLIVKLDNLTRKKE